MTPTLIILVFSNAGYWFGGSSGRVTAQWALAEARQRTTIAWTLASDGATLADGRILLEPDKEQSELVIDAPNVRRRTVLILRYRATGDDGTLLAAGEHQIHLYPRDLLADLKDRYQPTWLYVLDSQGALAKVLERAGIAHTRINNAAELAMVRPRVVLVAEDELSDQTMSQTALVGQARAGASVLMFPQPRAGNLIGYALARRRISPLTLSDVATRLVYRNDHPLLAMMRPTEWAAIEGLQPDALVVRLPADEPALEIVYFDREAPGTEPAPIDALIVTKAVGQGRITICQWPSMRWEDDPLSHLLLRGALEYVLSRPEPTARPSQRPDAPRPADQREPVITVPSGARP